MKNILIVDDDTGVRKILATILASVEEYQVYMAADAAEARHILMETGIDLVLTDIEMPGESGIDLAQYIRQHHPDTGVVLISIIADPDVARKALEIGLYGYLLKPFDRRQVAITVANALRRQELELDNKARQMELESEVATKTCRLDQSLQEIEAARTALGTSNKTLQSQLLFMKTLLDAIPHPVFYKDINGFFLGINEAAKKFFGIRENEIVGLRAKDIFTDEITEKARESDLELLNSKSKVSYETELENAQGQMRKFIATKGLYYDADGKPSGIVVILMDITEKLTIERELLQSQKMASIGQLAAGVAHEINNPTGFVSSNLKTLGDYHADLKRLLTAQQKLMRHLNTMRSDATDQTLKERMSAVAAIESDIDLPFLLEDIQALIKESSDGTERIKKIVEDLKHFAHPGQDKIQETDINLGLETTLNIVNNELKYTATVIKDLGDLPMILANPQQLNQVFANILVNAAHAIETNGEIRIRTRHVDDRIEVCISDTGCGISQKDLKKIFDPFFTTKEIGKGTGLGMNIAYNIITKHHGTIQVESEVGEGTRFTIRLPVRRDGKPADTSSAGAEASCDMASDASNRDGSVS